MREEKHFATPDSFNDAYFQTCFFQLLASEFPIVIIICADDEIGRNLKGFIFLKII